MTGPFTRANATNDILERLTGETADPGRVRDVARSLAERAIAPLRAALSENSVLPLTVELGEVEVTRMRQTIADAGLHDAVCVASSVTAPDMLVIRMEAAALAVFVDAFFGASPDMPVQPIARDLSGVELEVANLVAREVAGAVNGSGPRSLQMRFPLPSAQAGEAAKALVVRDGPAVRISLTVRTGSGAGAIHLAMPQRVLAKPRDAAAGAPASVAGSGEWTARFSEEVMRSTVRLEATMPVGKMTLGAIAALRSGQVIELARSAPTQTRLSARNKTLFICEFGRLGQNYTVRIRSPFDAGEDAVNDPALR